MFQTNHFNMKYTLSKEKSERCAETERYLSIIIIKSNKGTEVKCAAVSRWLA